MTVQLWGEFPKGDWKLTVSSSDGSAGKHNLHINYSNAKLISMLNY